MCGIFGYYNYQVPRDRATILSFLINGLRRLEYRGYDSSGICIDGVDGEVEAACNGSNGSVDHSKQNGNLAEHSLSQSPGPQPANSLACALHKFSCDLLLWTRDQEVQRHSASPSACIHVQPRPNDNSHSLHPVNPCSHRHCLQDTLCRMGCPTLGPWLSGLPARLMPLRSMLTPP